MPKTDANTIATVRMADLGGGLALKQVEHFAVPSVIATPHLGQILTLLITL